MIIYIQEYATNAFELDFNNIGRKKDLLPVREEAG